MERALFLLIPTVLFGCDGSAGDDSSSATPSCGDQDVTVDTVPAPGAVDHYYRANIEFHLSDPDPGEPSIETDIPGHQEMSDDGEIVYWVLDAALAPKTTYTATLHYCGGDVELSFTTSDLGTTIDDTSTLVGNTYALALKDARIVEPDGIGAALSSYLDQDILIGVNAVDGTDIQMVGAVGMDGAATPTQDFCDPTIPFPVADFSEAPYFKIGPQSTQLSIAGIDIDIDDLEITGTFSPDGTYFGGGTLSGTIDTRPLDTIVGGEGAEEGFLCTFAATFQANCVACSSDGEPFCLTLVADQLVAEEVSGSIKEVAGNDCTDCATWSENTVPLPEEQICPPE